MRKILIAFLVILSCSSLVAKPTSYDIGGGQTLLLNEDGSYEIIANDIDTSAFVGKQYTLDIMRTLDPFITLAMMEDPTAALLGKEFYYSLLEESGAFDLIVDQIPNVSLIFLSEDTVFYDGCGKPIASVFSFSYFRNDVPNLENRPVIFAFNGGPGTSSFMLHAGFLGTKRVSYSEDVDSVSGLPPYAVSDNMDCLLDTADIVLYDPVETGFGTLLDESKKEEFFGIEKDAEIFLCFVEKWLQRYKIIIN